MSDETVPDATDPADTTTDTGAPFGYPDGTLEGLERSFIAGLPPKVRRALYTIATPVGAAASAVVLLGNTVPHTVTLISGIVAVIATSIIGTTALNNTGK